jgi:hypothetical protein
LLVGVSFNHSPTKKLYKIVSSSYQIKILKVAEYNDWLVQQEGPEEGEEEGEQL